ncbi:MAG TPA: hypothetical protein VI685_04490 [Candidatus Angelobacter sp.]
MILPLRSLESAYYLFEKSLHLRMTGFVATQQSFQHGSLGRSRGAVTRPEMLSLNTSPASP